MSEDTGQFRYTEKYYAPISPDNPAGEEVPEYFFVEMLSGCDWPKNDFGRPDPEQRPNFRQVKTQALQFLDGGKETTAVKDIRPLLCLALAEGAEGGPVGLARTIDLFVVNMLDYWDAIHPGKEDDDDDEMMTRMEELRRLFNAPLILMAVETAPVAKSPRVGALTPRSFMIASGKAVPRAGEFAPNEDALHTLLAEEEEARGQAESGLAAYRHCIARLQEFESFLGTKPDLDPLDLEPLIEGLEKQAGFLAIYAGGGAATGATDSGESEDATGDPALDGEAPLAAAPASRVSGPQTRDDALALLRAVIAYYAKNARSSPIPLALIALQDLMEADFNAWVGQTIGKDAGTPALNISGVNGAQLDAYAASDGVPAAPQIDAKAVASLVAQMGKTVSGIESALSDLQHSEEWTEGLTKSLNTNVLGRIGKVTKLMAQLDEQLAGTVLPEDGEGTEAATGGPVEINDRDGVKRALELAASYWERAEPSNPAPGYLRRMRSLVDARFQEIARELLGEKGSQAHLRLE